MSHAHKVDAGAFFPAVRSSIFHKLNQGQVDGMNIIITAWDSTPLEDLRWLAYMLGTAYHETAMTMQPIHEYGNADYFRMMYDIQGRRPSVARSMGNTHPGDGAKYCGRGFVQLTWHDNYMRAGVLLGVDLVANPDLAMQPNIAAKIMFEGMTRNEMLFEDHTGGPGEPGGPGAGTDFSFTGRTLEDYFSGAKADWVGARRIINGTDHAAIIAATVQEFNSALRYH